MNAQAARSTNPWLVLLVLCLGFFMILLDTTIVYVATPSMLTNLHTSLDSVLWVFNGYLLSYAVLLITAGRLGDIFGPKRMFLAGLILFTLASAACGFSNDANTLIAARVLQGVGGALLSPQPMAFITALFPPQRRGAAFGVLGGVIGLATALGPTLGGLIVTYADWRWIFFLNLPVGALALLGTALLVPDLRPGRSHRLDLVGVALASAALLAIVHGLIEGQRYNWGTISGLVTIPGILAAGAVLTAVFFVWESRQAEPLVPLGLFRKADFSAGSGIGAALAFGMQAVFIPLTIYTQSVLGMSALLSGLTFLPMSVITMFAAPLAGRLTDRVGARRILMAGLLLFGAGSLLASRIASTTSDSWSFLPAMVLMGVGLGLTMAPLTTAAMRRISPALAGAASSVLNTTRQLGAAMGAAMVGAVLQNRMAVHLGEQARVAAAGVPAQLRQAFIDGFAKAGQGGLQVGVGQTGGVHLPAALQALATQVFDNAYLAAMRPTIAVGVMVLLLGAAGALALERQAAPRAEEVLLAA